MKRDKVQEAMCTYGVSEAVAQEMVQSHEGGDIYEDGNPRENADDPLDDEGEGDTTVG